MLSGEATHTILIVFGLNWSDP